MDKNLFLIELSESDRTDHGRVNFSLQPPKQQVFSCIWSLESQVNSGGFSAFFEYEDPALVAFTPEALSTIGAVNCAEIVKSATQLAAGADIEEIDEELGELDDEFYAYPDDLTELLFAYVIVNQDAFGATATGA